MSSRNAPRLSPRREPPAPRASAWPRRLAVVAGAAIVAALTWAWRVAPESPQRLRARAEAASRAGDWPEAARSWHAVNRTRLARGRTFLAEARACLALDLAARAERASRRAVEADPSDPEPWRLLLQRLRVEDRPLDALRVGWEAYDAVTPEARRDVLRELTLALLAELPDALAGETLDRWIAADPADDDARAARLQRADAAHSSAAFDRAARVSALADLLGRDPGNLVAREALATALADAGEPDRGRPVVDDWPADARDARYWRLRGRWDLEYDRRPDDAVVAFRKVVKELPYDWKTHYRLARALRAIGRPDEAKQAAETLGRLRETLDPAALGPRLGAALDRPDDPASCRDLADLCERVGLTRLAEAWRREQAHVRKVPLKRTIAEIEEELSAGKR